MDVLFLSAVLGILVALSHSAVCGASVRRLVQEHALHDVFGPFLVFGWYWCLAGGRASFSLIWLRIVLWVAPRT